MRITLLLVVVLSLAPTYYCRCDRRRSVPVFTGQRENDLNLNLNNTALLNDAACTGTTLRVNVLRSSQTVVSQHGVCVELNCQSLLQSIDSQSNPVVKWFLRRLRVLTGVYEPILERIQNDASYNITGVSDSLLIFETNILTTDRTQNGGIYTCRVCTNEDTDRESCVIRNTTVYLAGERPVLKPLGCETLASKQLCQIGGRVSWLRPGSRSETQLLQLSLTCETVSNATTSPAFPLPSRIWKKDDAVVFRSFPGQDSLMLEPEFMEDNHLLFLIKPLPIDIISSDQISLNFEGHNATMIDMFPMGVTQENLPGFLYEQLLGNWSCFISNIYGSDNATTTVQVKDNCTTEELRCTPVGVAECEGSINGTRCICPLQYELERDGTTCKAIDECTNDTDCSSNQVCRRIQGRLACICRDTFVYYNVTDTCLDCGWRNFIENGNVRFTKPFPNRVVAEIECNSGFTSLYTKVTCSIHINGGNQVVTNTTGKLGCQPEGDTLGLGLGLGLGGLGLVIVIAAVAIVVIIIYRHGGHAYSPQTPVELKQRDCPSSQSQSSQ